MQVSGIVNVNTADNVKNQNAMDLPFSNVAPGESTTAEVVAVDGKQVTLKTADGTEVKTEFPAGTQVVPGDSVELTMVEKGQNMVHLKLSAINGQTVNLEADDLQVYLMKQGVQPSQINQNAAELLVRHQISPTPERIAQLFEIAARFPELPSSVAVFMADNQIPATQENVDAIMKWVADPASLGKDVAQLGAMITEAGAAQESGAGVSSMQPDVLADAMVKEFVGKASPAQRGAVTEASVRELAARISTMEPQEAMTAIREFVAQTGLPQGERQGLELLLAAGYRVASAEGEPAGNTVQTPDMGTANTKAENNKTADAEIARPGTAQTTERTEIKTQNGAQGERPAQQAGAQPTVDKGAAGEAKQLLNMLEKFFAPIRKDVPADAKTLEATLKNQQSLADAVKAGVTRMLGEQSPAAQRTNDLSAQARLGNQMDNFYYCQVPFQMNNEKNTAELYVFQRNRGKEDGEAEHVTVLIALDTQNIGRVESVMRAAGESLSIEFRVETDRVEAYLSSARDEFAADMEEGGFHIDQVTVRKIDEPITPLNAMKVLEKAPEVNIRGIDIQI